MTTTETKKKIEKWAIQTGKTVEEITTLFETAMSEFADITDDTKRELQARRVTRIRCRAGTSKAEPYVGVVIAEGECRDILMNMHAAGLSAIAKNQDSAVANKLACYIDANNNIISDDELATISVDVLATLKAVPADPRPTFGEGAKARANPSYGKPLKPVLMKDMVLISGPQGTDPDTWLPTRLNMRNAQARISSPIGVAVNFGAINKTPEGITDEITLASSTSTTFTQTEVDGFDLFNLLDTKLLPWCALLGQLRQKHEDTKDDWNRIVVSEGDAVFSPRISEDGGRHMLLITDESMDDDSVGQQDITCWIPNHLLSQLDFGKESRVLIVGRTSLGFGYDREKREQTKNRDRIMLNILGLFARPERKTSPDEVANIPAVA